MHDLLRATADAALLPHQAAVALDAIARVWYRRLISRRGLLEWTAQATHWKASRRQPVFIASLTLGSLFSGAAGWAIWQAMPESLPLALPWLGLWFFSPLLGWLLNLRPAERRKTVPCRKRIAISSGRSPAEPGVISQHLSARKHHGCPPTTTRSPISITWPCVPAPPTSACG